MKTNYQIKELSYLIFSLGKEQFAANVEKIIEVIRDAEITEVPRTEVYIEGIINFRGEIVTVVNNRKKIGLSEETRTEKPVIIVFELEFDGRKIRIGAFADKVNKVVMLNENEVHPVPDFGSYYNPEFLEGAIQTPIGFVMTLNVEKIFSSKDVEIFLKNETNKT
jgi:purine-binding chemotaxis protein CheW